MKAYSTITGFVWRSINWLTGVADKVLCRITHIAPAPCKGRPVYDNIAEWAAMMAYAEPGLTDKERSALFNVLISNHQQLYTAPHGQFQPAGVRTIANVQANFTSGCQSFEQLKENMNKPENLGKSISKQPWNAALDAAKKNPGKTWGLRTMQDNFQDLVTKASLQKQLAASTTLKDAGDLAEQIGRKYRGLFGVDQTLEVLGAASMINVVSLLQTPGGELYTLFPKSGDMYQALKMFTNPNGFKWMYNTPLAKVLKTYYNNATADVKSAVQSTLMNMPPLPTEWGTGKRTAPSTQWLIAAVNRQSTSVLQRSQYALQAFKEHPRNTMDNVTVAGLFYFQLTGAGGTATQLIDSTKTMLVKETDPIERNKMVSGLRAASTMRPPQMDSKRYYAWFNQFFGITRSNQGTKNAWITMNAMWTSYFGKKQEKYVEPTEWIEPRHHTAKVGLIKSY
jgi:hypothetical protein